MLTTATGKLLRFDHKPNKSFFPCTELYIFDFFKSCLVKLFLPHGFSCFEEESCTFKMDSFSVLCFPQGDSDAGREEMTLHTRNTRVLKHTVF